MYIIIIAQLGQVTWTAALDPRCSRPWYYITTRAQVNVVISVFSNIRTLS